MEKLLKCFILLPEKDDGNKLLLALAFYGLVPSMAATMLTYILVFTIILAPVGMLIPFVGALYTYIGIAYSILKYLGKDITLK